MTIDSKCAAKAIINALESNGIEACIVCKYGLECPFSEDEYDCTMGVIGFLEDQDWG